MISRVSFRIILKLTGKCQRCHLGRRKGISPNQTEMAAEKKRNFLEELIESIWQPGTNKALICAINISFTILISVNISLFYVFGWSIHFLILLMLTIIVAFLINW